MATYLNKYVNNSLSVVLQDIFCNYDEYHLNRDVSLICESETINDQ